MDNALRAALTRGPNLQNTPQSNTTLTTNGALTLKSTLNPVLDLFALAGATRDRDVTPLFSKAYAADPTLAVATAFYLRDIRGSGQGERKTFLSLLQWLYTHQRATFYAVLPLVPHYGRWSDIISYVNDDQVVNFVDAQLDLDMSTDKPSLLAKWLPSENTSSKETRKLARAWIKALGTTARNYRVMLSHLRRQINVLERMMSAGEWSNIDYAHVPSRAGMIYRAAFHKRDGERYTKYLEEVTKGTKKINTKALYPYEIAERVLSNYGSDPTLEVMWKNLPDYVKGNASNALVVADVSGSMSGTPMAVSVSLALYFAERSKGAFANSFITFDTTPQLLQVKGKTLWEKMRNIYSAPWGGSTNLQGVFDLVLNTAVRHKVPADDMPRMIFIISDMEFNVACGRKTNLETIRKKYHASGYDMPTLVFWNVRSMKDQVPANGSDKGVFLVSGCSPTVFKNALNAEATTPAELMLEVLESERYAPVIEAMKGVV